MTLAIQAFGLGKKYGRKWGLRDCSLDLPAGCRVALVGPNGAGKSTLIHLITGLISPTEGRLRVLDASIPANSRALDTVGFVAQNRPLYDTFSVAEMLDVGRRLNRRWDGSAARQRLARLGIPFDSHVRDLSGGQRAQVALSMALGKRPSILVLDEPVASLDPLARQEFLEEVTAVSKRDGVTVVISSHILAELGRACDYLVILSAGSVQAAGEVRQLLAHRQREAAGSSAPGADLTDSLEALALDYLRRSAPSSTSGGRS